MYYFLALHPGVVSLLVLEPFRGIGLRARARGVVTSKFPRTLFYAELFFESQVLLKIGVLQYYPQTVALS